MVTSIQIHMQMLTLVPRVINKIVFANSVLGLGLGLGVLLDFIVDSSLVLK